MSDRATQFYNEAIALAKIISGNLAADPADSVVRAIYQGLAAAYESGYNDKGDGYVMPSQIRLRRLV